jgi:hypothetical protein
MFDVALERGVRELHRLDRSADLIAAHIWRISIAQARGESGRASELLARAIHYDPLLDLEPGERSPQLSAAVDEARRSIADPPLPADLGDACREFAVVITGRMSTSPGAAGDAPQLELFRFDGCILVARTVVSGDGDADLAPLLEPEIDPAVAAAARPRRLTDAVAGRALRIAGIAASGLGLGLVAVAPTLPSMHRPGGTTSRPGAAPRAVRRGCWRRAAASMTPRLTPDLWIGGGGITGRAVPGRPARRGGCGPPDLDHARWRWDPLDPVVLADSYFRDHSFHVSASTSSDRAGGAPSTTTTPSSLRSAMAIEPPFIS